MTWLDTFDPHPKWLIWTLHGISIFATIIFALGMSCITFVKVLRTGRIYRNMLCVNMALNYLAQFVVSTGTIPIIHMALGGGYPLGFFRDWGIPTCGQLTIGVVVIGAAAGCTVALFIYRHTLLRPCRKLLLNSSIVALVSLSILLPGPFTATICLTANFTDYKLRIYEENQEKCNKILLFWDEYSMFLYFSEFNLGTIMACFAILAVLVMFIAIFGLVFSISFSIRSRMISESSRRLHRSLVYSLVAQVPAACVAVVAFENVSTLECREIKGALSVVQGRRDPIIPRVKHGSGENGNCTPSTSKNGVKIEEPFLLHKIMRNYRKMCDEKKSIELMMDPSIIVRANQGGPLKGFSMGRSSQLSAFNKAHTPALWEFATSTFEEFNSLTKEEQFTLFPSFIALLWGMDHCYHTFKQVPKDMYSYISIVSETTYFDFNQCEVWLSGLSPQAESLRTDIIKTIKSSRTKAKLKQLYLMDEMKLEEEEYATLLGLILWNQNFESISEEMDGVVKTMRARIFKQLEFFYLSKGMKSYAERLGELMGLHGTILVDAIRFREDMEVFNLLQAVEKDDVFFESMRNSQCF